MRGKKADAEFVAEFIVNCAKAGITNPIDVCAAAERKIQTIDEEIRRVEELKKQRSKLSDVINTLGTKSKDNSEDKKLLTFYQLSNLDNAHNIARSIQEDSITLKSIDKSDAVLVKEMLSAKVLRRDGDRLAQGDEYLRFLDFCLKNGY